MKTETYSPKVSFVDNSMKTVEKDRITIEPTTHSIASCNCCGRANYDRSNRDGIVPSGLKLFNLGITSNGYQTSITVLCPDCVKDLRAKLFPFSA